MSANNQCNIYATNPLLKDVKTKFDEELSNVTCQWVERQDTGPNPVPNQKPSKMMGGCPFMSLDRAYAFNPGPNPVNRKPTYNIK